VQSRMKDERDWNLQKVVAASAKLKESRRLVSEANNKTVRLSKLSITKERKEQESRLHMRHLEDMNRS